MGQWGRTGMMGSALAVVFAVGFVIGDYGDTTWVLSSRPESMPAQVDFDPVWKAWRILDEKFVPATTTTRVESQERVWGLISGLAASYNDPYTVFLPPREAKTFEEEISGSFGGVGIEIGFRKGILTVIAPLKSTPAEQAGIRTGDLIVEVDGVSTQAMSMDEAVLAIRGDAGTEVVFTIAREGENEFLTIPVMRAYIDVPTLAYEVVRDDIFVISLYNFGGTATREMHAALRTFVAGSYDKLLLDLRGNPGGYLTAAVEVAGWFLPAGKVVVTEDFGPNRESIVHRSKGRDITEQDWRIAVLIDGGSASASEILAGALREHGKAILIGTQTFGKGSVQELVDITPDTALKVTVARWLTPNGLSISDAGLTPDVVIEPDPYDDPESGTDPQKDAALSYLATGVLPPHASSTAPTTVPLEASSDLE